MHEIGLSNDPNVRIDEVKAMVTLRSGKELRPAVPALVKSVPTVATHHKKNSQQVGKR